MKSTFIIEQMSPTSYRIVDIKGAVVERSLTLPMLLKWVVQMQYLGYGIDLREGFERTSVFEVVLTDTLSVQSDKSVLDLMNENVRFRKEIRDSNRSAYVLNGYTRQRAEEQFP